jgi:NAD(P)-dependent dehydrogenase (short-subunit alcohol dehydrogenase family)
VSPVLQPGRLAVVTGAGAGIGRALAHQMADLGLNVLAIDRDVRAAQETVDALSSGVSARAVGVDVADADQMAACAADAREEFGQAAVLFNNAGILRAGSVLSTTDDEWALAWNVNVMGVVNGIRAFVPDMIDAGLPAHVVNTASIGGLVNAPGVASYVATKHAVVGLTENLRDELAAEGAGHVGVSVLCPGGVSTQIWATANSAATPADELSRGVLDAMSQPRPEQATPEQIAQLAVNGVRDQQFWIVAAQSSLHPRLLDRNAEVASAMLSQSVGLYP